MTLKANYRCIEENPNYFHLNGKFVHLFVIQLDATSYIHFARGDNQRVINLNGYAWADTFKEMENELSKTPE